jgi:hypothetical protein
MALANLETPKRGYLAQILMIPPLIYPFQYNPAQLTDTKRNDWKRRPANPTISDKSKKTKGKWLKDTLSTATEVLGREFSRAELKQFASEGDRTLSFKFTVDGRELRSGEPKRRRNDEGDIIGDLSVLRSFVYPQLAGDFDILAALGGPPTPPVAAPGAPAPKPDPEQPPAATFSNLWFNHPPSVALVMGSMTMEGFITELKITETLFNSKLNPTRAEIDVTMIEKIDSLSFILDSVKRVGKSFYYSAYEDFGKVIF